MLFSCFFIYIASSFLYSNSTPFPRLKHFYIEVDSALFQLRVAFFQEYTLPFIVIEIQSVADRGGSKWESDDDQENTGSCCSCAAYRIEHEGRWVQVSQTLRDQYSSLVAL